MLHRRSQFSLLLALLLLAACGADGESTEPTPSETSTRAATMATPAPPEQEPTAPGAATRAETMATPAPPEQEPTAAAAPAGNLTDDCVEQYEAGIDYFPDKADLAYATNLTIDYFDHYKVLNVLQPYPGAAEALQYVLVQCGTPAPDGFENALVIEVPTGRFISMSTTYLPYLVALGQLDRLVGVDSFNFVTSAEVRALIDAGALSEVASGGQLNVEAVLEAEPDMVMTFGTGSPEFDAAPRLLEVGVPAVYSGDFLETDPLGRTEWVQFIAAFFNAEAAAATWFDGVAAEYETLRALAATAPERPSVFLNTPYEGTWYLPGGEGYQARLLSDAGADYVGSDIPGTASPGFDFEAVLDRAAAADYWINVGFFGSLADLTAADERFAEFAAFQNGSVYNYDKLVSANGGFDYFESGAANPDVVLADLLAIFHPELLPDHVPVYYRRLPEG